MSDRSNVYDGKGKKIGTIIHRRDRDDYYDPAGRYEGRTDAHGTRDPAGRLIADKPAGGLLWSRKK